LHEEITMERSPSISPEELQAQCADFDVLDVRRTEHFESAHDMIERAVWADPRNVDAWAGALHDARKVAVYCVHGHHVSQDTVAALRARGIDAHYLEGGIAKWKEEGRPVQPKGEAS
jgi:rhodanese-related sulfurtransferase